MEAVSTVGPWQCKNSLENPSVAVPNLPGASRAEPAAEAKLSPWLGHFLSPHLVAFLVKRCWCLTGLLEGLGTPEGLEIPEGLAVIKFPSVPSPGAQGPEQGARGWPSPACPSPSSGILGASCCVHTACFIRLLLR